MIAASLRSCSLASPSSLPQLVEASGESGGVTVELNSELPALPCNWEQCLDLKTGVLYYKNWVTGAKTTEDPRRTTTSCTTTSSSACGSSNQCNNEVNTSDNYEENSSSSCSVVAPVANYTEDSEDTANSSTLSTISSPSPAPKEGSSSGQVLVAAGCKACFMHFMVPKCSGACPKCGAELLHL